MSISYSIASFQRSASGADKASFSEIGSDPSDAAAINSAYARHLPWNSVLSALAKCGLGTQTLVDLLGALSISHSSSLCCAGAPKPPGMVGDSPRVTTDVVHV